MLFIVVHLPNPISVDKETRDSATRRLSPWEGNAHLELDLRLKPSHRMERCIHQRARFSVAQKTQRETCGARAGARASAPVRVCFEFKCQQRNAEEIPQHANELLRLHI